MLCFCALFYVIKGIFVFEAENFLNLPKQKRDLPHILYGKSLAKRKLY